MKNYSKILVIGSLFIGSIQASEVSRTSSSSPLHIAAFTGDERQMRSLLTNPRVGVNTADQEGYTPLYAAADAGHAGVVRVLLEDRRCEVNKADQEGHTPLYGAAYQGHEGVVSLLLGDRRCKVNKAGVTGWTPLYAAATYGHEGVVRLLLGDRRCNINKADQDGFTPLYVAADEGHEGVVSLLLGDRRCNINKAGLTGFTPLYAAADQGHEGVVRLLLGDRRCDINKAQQHGFTPLYAAADQGHEEVVRLLLGDRRCDINKADQDGDTPLHAAAEQRHQEITRLLIHSGALDITDNEGRSCLDQAKDDETRQVMIEAWETASSADQEDPEREEDTDLKRALEESQREIARLKLEQSRQEEEALRRALYKSQREAEQSKLDEEGDVFDDQDIASAHNAAVLRQLEEQEGFVIGRPEGAPEPAQSARLLAAMLEPMRPSLDFLQSLVRQSVDQLGSLTAGQTTYLSNDSQQQFDGWLGSITEDLELVSIKKLAQQERDKHGQEGIEYKIWNEIVQKVSTALVSKLS